MHSAADVEVACENIIVDTTAAVNEEDAVLRQEVSLSITTAMNSLKYKKLKCMIVLVHKRIHVLESWY